MCGPLGKSLNRPSCQVFFFVRPTYFYHLWKTIDQHYILVSGFKGDWNNPWERQVTFRGWSSIRAKLRQKPSHLEFHLWISPIMPASSGSWERPDGFWQERQRVYTHFTSLKLFFFSLKTFNTNLGSQEHLKVCFWAAHNLIKKKKIQFLFIYYQCAEIILSLNLWVNGPEITYFPKCVFLAH